MSTTFESNVAKDLPFRHVISLDLPPNKRWNHLVTLYKERLVAVEEHLTNVIKKEAGKLGMVATELFSSILGCVNACGVIYYGEEIRAISAITGISTGKLAALQLVYEASACCTSIIVKGDDGKPHHIRTMDWEMDFLHDLTIEIDFQKNGKTCFIASSWVGYVGILTGMKPGVCSISVNFRLIGDSLYKNFKKAVTRSWPVGFLVREVLESTTSYDLSLSWLENSNLISPCYFTVCGTKSYEGALITRTRTETEHRIDLSDRNIVQTNIEHWNNNIEDCILWSIDRRKIALERIEMLEKTNQINEESLWHLLEGHPITNTLTVYGTYMRSATGILHTTLKLEGRLRYIEDEEREGAIEKAQPCSVCDRDFFLGTNVKGSCAHFGEWHAGYSQCSVLKCSMGLSTNIGRQHWSCCFSLEKDEETCKESPFHTTDPKGSVKSLNKNNNDPEELDDNNNNRNNNNNNRNSLIHSSSRSQNTHSNSFSNKSNNSATSLHLESSIRDEGEGRFYCPDSMMNDNSNNNSNNNNVNIS